MEVLTAVIRRQSCSIAVVSTLSHLSDGKSWIRYIGLGRYFLYSTAFTNHAYHCAQKTICNASSLLKTNCNASSQRRQAITIHAHDCLQQSQGSCIKKKYSMTRDSLIDSSVELIHTYVNRVRGRLDDVTVMLHWRCTSQFTYSESSFTMLSTYSQRNLLSFCSSNKLKMDMCNVRSWRVYRCLSIPNRNQKSRVVV